MLSKVDINLLIKLTRFNFVSHRGSIKSMTKNTVNDRIDGRGEFKQLNLFQPMFFCRGPQVDVIAGW